MVTFCGCAIETNTSQKDEGMHLFRTDTGTEYKDVQKKESKPKSDDSSSIDTQEETTESDAKTTSTADVEKPYPLETPPFSYYLSDAITAKEEKPLTFTMQSSEKNKITDEQQWVNDNQISLQTYAVGSYSQIQEKELPKQIPTDYSGLILTKAFYDDTYIYCTYGADYSEGYILNIYEADTDALKYSFDFSNYEYPPKYDENDYDYIKQRVLWASIKDDTLYVSHSHSTYASSSNGDNAYITAIDLKDNSILWNSDSLVCNANNFVIYDQYILCGYGFTEEADYLYQLNLTTGATIDRIKLRTSPEYIVLKNSKLYVRSYDTNYVFTSPNIN